MKKIIFVFLSFIQTFSVVYAVKAYPGMIQINQPDGSILDVYLYGDEKFSYMTSEDGFLLKYNEFGAIEYAIVASDDVIRPIGILAHNKQERTLKEQKFLNTQYPIENYFELKMLESRITRERKENVIQYARQSYSNEGFPLEGAPKSLVILVNFTNMKFTSPTANADFAKMLNQYNYTENGATGSARDYFRIASSGRFEPEFVVVGPYDLPETMAYYGQQEGNNIDKRPGNMIVDACTIADKDIDFAEFDTNGDGYVDNVFVYYAGYNQAEGAGDNTIWPHRSAVLSDVVFDGVYLYDYACTSEFRSNKGKNMCGIGTFVHEFGHVLSLPDLYDTEYSGHKTLGAWDVMDNGSYNNQGRTPPTYSAYERFYLGWLTPTQLVAGQYNLEPISISNTAYLVANNKHNLDGNNPDSKEFFLLENRHNAFECDGVPANGMLVSRINYDKRTWKNNIVNNDPDKMGVQIVCAAGSTSQPYQNVFPGSMKKTSLSFIINDTLTIDSITSIISQDSTIYFVYGAPNFIPTVDVLNKLNIFDVELGEFQLQTLSLKGYNIFDGSVKLTLSYAKDYQLRLSNSIDTAFYDSLEIDVDETGSFVASIDIRYWPSESEILSYHYDNIIISSECSEYNVSLRGKARKPIVIDSPIAYKADNVTPYEFRANWSVENGATGYYLSVYRLETIDTIFVKNKEFLSLDTLQCETKFLISNLEPLTTYYYRLQASDKDEMNGVVENITNYSNEISVTTLFGFGVESRNLDILKQGDTYVVYLPTFDENHSIFVYSVDGKLITSVSVNSNIVEIPQLQSKRVYILKYASNEHMNAKSKVIKFYYE